MPEYDPRLLQAFAERTHRQAGLAIYGGIAAGIISGGLFGFATTLMFYIATPLLIPGAIVGGIVGIRIGQQRALALRLQSQTALCQLKIEENTRKLSPVD